MNIFTNKSIWKKIVIALLIVLSFQIMVMPPVHADVVEFGGKLISPILSLVVSLSDGIMDVIGRTIMGANSSLIEVDLDSSFWDKMLPILIGILAAAVFLVLSVATLGVATVAAAAVGIPVMATLGVGTIIGSIATGVFVGTWFDHEVMPDDLYLPMYTYSAEEIFKGNIMLFDVNFFETDKKEIYAMTSDGTPLKVSDYADEQKFQEEVKKHGKEMPVYTQGNSSKEQDSSGKTEKKEGEVQYYYWEDHNHLNEDGTPMKVKTSNQNSVLMLRKTVSSWYNAIRNICIVLMLSVLVYIGIRILLASVASDKAKYMTMLKDWLVGLCLLFLMHYIMAFSVMLVEKLTNVVKTSMGANGYIVVLEDEEGKDGPLCETVRELGQEELIQEGPDGKTYVSWPTNLMGDLRVRLQMEEYGAQYIGLCICFIMLCLFTLYFTIIYLKRVLHIAFLTIIAPMVALTYCIDKLNDGKAQGFDKWIKEYIFNLLIQPMHLLLYYILVSSVFELAGKNVIYSIVALGFMLPAEKMLRSLFGFEKAQTAPGMGPAGAMMASTALNHLLNRGKKNQSGKDGGSGSGNSDSDSGRVPNPDDSTNPMASFLNGGQEDASQQGPETPNEQPNSGNADDWTPEEVAGGERGQIDTGRQYSDDVYDAYGIDPSQPPEMPQPSKMRRLMNSAKTGAANRIGSSATGRRMIRSLDASWAAQKAAIRMTPQKIKDRIQNSHPLKAAGKAAAGIGLGAAAGAVGLGIAATTGDPGNIAKLGGGLAAAGYAVGSGKAGSIKSPMDDETVKAVYDNTYNKGKYKEDAMQDYIDNYKKNEKYRNYLERKFDAKTAKEMIEGGEVEEYLRNNITDIKDMAAMHKLQKDGVVKNRKQAIGIAQLSQMVGSDTNNMDGVARSRWEGRFGDMSGIQDKDRRSKFAKQRLAEVDKFYDYKK